MLWEFGTEQHRESKHLFLFGDGKFSFFFFFFANFLKGQLNYLWIFRGMRSESLLPLQGLAKLGRLKQAAS